MCACVNLQVGELYLEGCTFDGKHLSENERNSATVAAIPACSMGWVPKVLCRGMHLFLHNKYTQVHVCSTTHVYKFVLH